MKDDAKSQATGSDFYGPDLARVHAADFAARWDDAVPWLAERAKAVAPTFGFDIGCGDGRLLSGLRDHGIDGAGVDLSPALVSLAVARGLDVRTGNATNTDIPRASLIVSLGEVLAYIDDTESWTLPAVIEKVASALRPGGSFVFDVTGPDVPETSGWREGEGWFVASRTSISGADLLRDIVTFIQEDGMWRRSLERHRQRLIPAKVVEILLMEHGLVPERLDKVGNVDLLPGRLGFIATKPLSS